MKYQFKLVDVIKLQPYKDKWQHWTRFIFNCSIDQEVIRIPVQVSIFSTVVANWEKLDEGNEEMMKRAYAFLRRNFETYFRSRVRDGLDILKKDLDGQNLVRFEIKRDEEASDKLDFSINEEFVIED